MQAGRTLLRFLFLSAVGHQVTYTLVEGGIFEGARRRLSAIHPKVDEFVHCHLCVGTWIGAVLATVYRPNLLADLASRPAGRALGRANVAGDALLIAFGSRLWNEVLGLLRREVQVKQAEVEAVQESVPDQEPRTLPGISIRP
jgi:hypothetical protein